VIHKSTIAKGHVQIWFIILYIYGKYLTYTQNCSVYLTYTPWNLKLFPVYLVAYSLEYTWFALHIHALFSHTEFNAIPNCFTLSFWSYSHLLSRLAPLFEAIRYWFTLGFWSYSHLFTIVQVGDVFDLMDSARSAIRSYILNQGESFKVFKSEKRLYILVCKDPDCHFRLCCIRSSKGVVKITKMDLHSCGPAIHYRNRQSQSVNHLLEHYYASILNNPKVKAR
jgi:hypothetical protein